MIKTLLGKRDLRFSSPRQLPSLFLILFMLLSPVFVSAQATRTIKGTVMENDGTTPIIGATVWLKESTIGASTGMDGSFSINVPTNATAPLVVSFVGYDPVELDIRGKDEFTVLLEQSSDVIDAVQVVGYGTQRKESVIGSISTVSVSELKVPTSSISSSLAGRLSGVVAFQRNGEPGASAEFWIRGFSTFGANRTPLILVDGVERPLDLLDPEEIDTFSILKDATATAVYGVRGANGVVLVTTKRGEEGHAKVQLKVETGLTGFTKLPKKANSMQFAELYNEMKGYEYYSKYDIDAYRYGYDTDLYPNVDWIGSLFKDYAASQRVTASVSGGGAIARYYVSGSFYHEDGMYISKGSYNGNPDFKRYNFRSNLDINLHPTTVLSLTLGGFLVQKNQSPYKDGIWTAAFDLSPNAYPIIYSDGRLSGTKEARNPYNRLTKNGYSEIWENTLNSVMELKQDFSKLVTPGLSAAVKFSFDALNWHNNTYKKEEDEWYAQSRDSDGELMFGLPIRTASQPSFESIGGGNNATYFEATVNYNRDFGRHSVGALLLYNHRKYSTTANNALESLPYKNQGLAGRVTYSYDYRYFIEGNFGYNGSENFAPGKRMGFFPSMALGWYVSNERFFEPLTKVISKFKIKGSIGQVGNDKIGGGRRFIYLPTVETGEEYVYGEAYNRPKGDRIGEFANDNVSWETSTKKNIGFELGLFGKLDIEADWFHDTRKNIFVQNNTIPAYVGLTKVPWVNIGKMKSWGFDLTAEYKQQFGDWYVSGRGTFTYSANKILRDGAVDNAYKYRNTPGQKIFQNRGYYALGLFESMEEIDRSPIQFSEAIHMGLRPGDIKYKDINGDGIINEDDQIPIGRSDVPEITYGFGLSATWKGIDLSAFFQGIGKVTLFEAGRAFNPFTTTTVEHHGFLEDVYKHRWRPDNPNPNAKYPRITDTDYNMNNNTYQSSFWQRDASYFRLKNLEVGYTLPKKWVEKIKMQSLRIYFSGVNLWTWSKEVKTYDPELGSTDGRKYPLMKVYNLGMTINF